MRIRECEATGKLGWNNDIKVAKELHYPKSVIELLKKEPDAKKRSRILHDERLGYLH